VGGDVLSDFLSDNNYVRCIRGPVGSGTSSACCVELFRRMQEQQPGQDGFRRTRWGIFRRTYRQLETTVLKTWLDWFPEQQFGRLNKAPPFTHYFQYKDVRAEVIFMPMGSEKDVDNCLSLELTGGFVNEARQLPKGVIDIITNRAGRYPSEADVMQDGSRGATWYGTVMDTNAPEPDHWWPIMSGEMPVPPFMPEEDRISLIKPKNWSFYTQQPAMLEIRDGAGRLTGYESNMNAENRQNLKADYYPNQVQGKSRDWIKVYILNQFGAVITGKAIYDEFRSETHVARNGLTANPEYPLLVGLDFGLTPAAVICQFISGRWFIVDELCMQGAGAKRFAERLRFKLDQDYSEWAKNRIRIWGDPSGSIQAQTDETTVYQIMRPEGIFAKPCYTNDLEVRIEAVQQTLKRLEDGRAGFLIDEEKAPTTTMGLKGYYQYRRMETAEERYGTDPDKNRWSHPSEALAYVMVAEGEGRRVVRGDNPRSQKPRQLKRKSSIFQRRREMRHGR
jgi:hypothetical protein